MCTPAVDFAAVSEAIRGTNIKLGAQNVHWKESGAYTGELSAAMLKEAGCEYVVIGHSERRQYFGETDETVNKRTLAALSAGLTPIVCIGETLEEREGGRTEAVLDRQIEEGMKGIDDISKIVIAYEPVWAIGTGKTATAEQANETIGFIRKTLAEGAHPVRRLHERGQCRFPHGDARDRRRPHRRRIPESPRLFRHRPLRQGELT